PVFGLTLVTVGAVDELIRRADGAGTARGGHRYINGTDPSWRGRGDLCCAVDGERAGRVVAEPDRSRVGKIGTGDGYTAAARRRTGIWIDVGDGRRQRRRRHIGELIGRTSGASTARGGHRCIHGTDAT